jgi:hypothetical protein
MRWSITWRVVGVSRVAFQEAVAVSVDGRRFQRGLGWAGERKFR